jgi:hypothetical protein
MPDRGPDFAADFERVHGGQAAVSSNSIIQASRDLPVSWRSSNFEAFAVFLKNGFLCEMLRAAS